MSILAWIEDQKRLKLLNAPKYVNPTSDSSKGLWTRCDKCGVILYIKHLRENQRVCFGCGYHLQMSSQERVETLLDKHSWRAFDETVSPCDPLEFHDQRGYTDRLQDAQERTGLQDAIQTGTGMVDGIPVALGVMDFDFMGGSMGSVVGEKITRLIEYATQEGLPLVLVSASGGARMQEGVFSLMQMAKISAALQVYQSCANLLYIPILTSPTTGGVTASFAMLGDIIFAEPKALIAFAGRRVIEQTLCEDLPEDFQTSEYMLHHGLVDLIIPRRFLRQALSESIRLYRNAPFKRHGHIPYGVQNPISFVSEERLRRQFANAKQAGMPSSASPPPASVEDAQAQQQLLAEGGGIDESPSAVLAPQPSLLTPPTPYSPWQARRESSEYRKILTSFDTMFHLVSNQRLVVDAYDSGKIGRGGLSPHQQEPLSTRLPILERFQSLSQRGQARDGTMRPFRAEEKGSTIDAHAADLDLGDEIALDAQSDSNDILHQAFDIASAESIAWRAFYVQQRISQADGFLGEMSQAQDAPVQQEGTSRQGGTGPPNACFAGPWEAALSMTTQNSLLYQAVCQDDASVNMRANAYP